MRAALRGALQSRRWVAVAVLVLSVVLIAEVAAVATTSYYRSRALPGIQVGTVDVSGKDAGQIAQLVSSSLPGPAVITIDAGGQQVIASPADLGLSVDARATAGQALATGRAGTAIGNLISTSSRQVAPVLVVDEAAAQAFLDKAFAGKIQPPADASVAYDKKAQDFVVTPARNGKRILAAEVLDGVKRLGPSLTGTVTVEPEPAAATVPTEAAMKARDQAAKMIAKDVPVMADGATIDTFTHEDLAAVIRFTPADGALVPAADPGAVREHLVNATESKVKSQPQPEIRLIGQDGKVRHTIPGDAGRTLTDPGKAAAAIAKAIDSGAGKAVDVSASAQAPDVKDVKDGEHWAVIHLKTQTADLMAGKTKLHTYVVSTGKPETPTPKGTFHIYLKRPIQDLSGGEGEDAYFHPADRWLSYFNGGIGFHSAYWHNDFGTPVSHGCINMREAEAKVVYDFLPMGAKVVVED